MGTTAYVKYPPEYNFFGKTVLNLGSGMTTYRAPNVINLDAYPDGGTDVIFDLDSGSRLPFDDNYFDFILANHILEHLRNWWFVFEECARVLKPKGIMEIWVPGNGNDGIFGYRDHIHQINACSFFGVFSNFHQGGNAWAEAHSRGPANYMKMTAMNKSMINAWWVRIIPMKMKIWACEHLRNVIVEQNYMFTKVTEDELQAKLKNERAINNPLYL